MYKYNPEDITLSLNYSMGNEESMKHLHKAIYDVKDIEGDLVEVGVYKGGYNCRHSLVGVVDVGEAIITGALASITTDTVEEVEEQ